MIRASLFLFSFFLICEAEVRADKPEVQDRDVLRKCGPGTVEVVMRATILPKLPPQSGSSEKEIVLTSDPQPGFAKGGTFTITLPFSLRLAERVKTNRALAVVFIAKEVGPPREGVQFICLIDGKPVDFSDRP